ncbi:acetolactate synthase-1/3 small subunit [Desulfosalsimonas propionicica]|uniref:Acetolactate synthase small subunit n=1 Tax=Desulfosalsimonas propionicica TaxID=332175 RepID=A0A7W0HLM2_9BACT|nr:acetolactate synthase small subunit [Desulfosalsimonas propionicica]MBA2882467.1 acetolactate synthase-1/3 small subunit [Desulfosalsimonas propionicica]
MNEKKHLLSILVDNEPGVLSRITGLFSGRGYNIESLSVAETVDPGISRITMVTKGSPMIIEQIQKQLNKLINVLKVIDLTGTQYVQREMALVKVNARADHRAEILRITDIFRGQVVDVGMEHFTLKIEGDAEKIEAVLNLLKPYGIREIARTGCVALPRENR